MQAPRSRRAAGIPTLPAAERRMFQVEQHPWRCRRKEPMKPSTEKSSSGRPPTTKPKLRHQGGPKVPPEVIEVLLKDAALADAKRRGDVSKTGARGAAATPAPPKPNIDVAGLLEVARDRAEKAAKAAASGTSLLAEALAHTLELRRLHDVGGSAEKDLAAAYNSAGIKVTKRTLNAFTPLVKLVFGHKLPRTDVSRYANVLWLADERGVEPEGFEQFLRTAGGVAACAEKAAAERRAGAQDASEVPVEKALKARRKSAKRVELPAEELPETDLISVLFERTADRSAFLMLGARPAKPGSARRYLPARRT
jgi:hypothetical protein